MAAKQGYPEAAIEVLNKLLADDRFKDFRESLLSIRSTAARRLALQGYSAPSAARVTAMLENQTVATVEDLRALMCEALSDVEHEIRFSETNALDVFYPAGKRVAENNARNRIVEYLKSYMVAKNLSVTVEHQLNGGNRCDITASSMY